VVFPSEAPDSTCWNKNFAADPPRGEPSGCDEVINRSNAQAECFGGVTPRIEQFFYGAIHAQSPY
jgi:hypothetical protein